MSFQIILKSLFIKLFPTALNSNILKVTFSEQPLMLKITFFWTALLSLNLIGPLSANVALI